MNGMRRPSQLLGVVNVGQQRAPGGTDEQPHGCHIVQMQKTDQPGTRKKAGDQVCRNHHGVRAHAVGTGHGQRLAGTTFLPSNQSTPALKLLF